MANVNNDISDELKTTTPKRRPLRATMSLTKFEATNDKEAKALSSTVATPEVTNPY